MIKQQIAETKQANARLKRPTAGDGEESELKSIDRQLARSRRENQEMREQLETYAGELDQAQRLKNAKIDLQARLKKEIEENELRQQLTQRQAEQLSLLGLSAAQKRELDRLRTQKEELNEQLRATAHRANELSRQQHAVQMQWSKLCGKHQRLKRGLEGEANALAEGTDAAENAADARCEGAQGGRDSACGPGEASLYEARGADQRAAPAQGARSRA
jgi:predicted  nucleic acid-binding Zn-ribbon protein